MIAPNNSRGVARLGIVVPVSNTNLEPDMVMLRPDGVSLHFARAGGRDRDTEREPGPREGRSGAVEGQVNTHTHTDTHTQHKPSFGYSRAVG